MKKRVLTELNVVADPPSVYPYFHRDPEGHAKALERWANDFNQFIRDHRSQDGVSLEVERVYEDQCEFCGYEWDVDDDGRPSCCNEALSEWELQQEKSDAHHHANQVLQEIDDG